MTNRINVDIGELRRLYWDREMTQREVAAEMGVSIDVVRDRMGAHDIPTRGPSDQTAEPSGPLVDRFGYGVAKSTRYRRPWEYENCPECETDVFVNRSNSQDEVGYICHFCDVRWPEGRGHVEREVSAASATEVGPASASGVDLRPTKDAAGGGQ